MRQFPTGKVSQSLELPNSGKLVALPQDTQVGKMLRLIWLTLVPRHLEPLLEVGSCYLKRDQSKDRMVNSVRK